MKKKIVIIGIFVILIITQIYLLSVQPINAKNMPYDDNLMLKQAYSILHGNWLGEYNSLTLVKGIMFPEFLATSKLIHIPFLVLQDICYIVACATIIYILRKKIKSPIVKILAFTILIFSPIIYCTEMCRVYRDGLYMSLIIYLLAYTLGLFINRKEKFKKLLKYYILIGITIGAIYLCREEFIWIIPYLTVSSILTLILILKDKKENEKKKKVLGLIIPFLIVVIMVTAVKIANYKYYGVFQLNQYWSQEFKEAYGALTRIIPEKKINKVPVTRKSLEKAYEISPKFAELKEYFEKNTLGWQLAGDGPEGEIQGGWFHWTLMKAVEEKGYYQNAKTANEYYKEVAEEINRACDENLINALPNKRVSNVILFDFNDILKAFKKTEEVIGYQMKLQHITVKKNRNSLEMINQNNEEIEQYVNKIEEITQNEIYTQNSYKDSKDKLRIDILSKIEKLYKLINPYLFYESIIVTIIYIIIVLIKKQKRLEELYILLGLTIVYFCRIFIISFTQVTMYTDAVNISYLAPTYPIQILFGILANIFFIQSIAKIKTKKEKTSEKIYKNEEITKELTILIPALNEEKTIGICVKKAVKVIKENNLNAEILVIDNNSTDNTSIIANKEGARVEKTLKIGYGVALQEGIRKAKGKYTIMVDADDSYNILEIMPIYEKLKEGYDLVVGNRFKGKMEKGAMKLTHKYFGTPILSWIGCKKYNLEIGDFNCGLRGFDTEKMLEINCNSEGMEYASEMIIKSKKTNLKVTEIPINFYKDKRKEKSHLNTIVDGIRHIKLILMENR